MPEVASCPQEKSLYIFRGMTRIIGNHFVINDTLSTAGRAYFKELSNKFIVQYKNESKCSSQCKVCHSRRRYIHNKNHDKTNV